MEYNDYFMKKEIFEATHWVMVHLKHLPLGKVYPIINVYMPNNYWEKVECWESLLGIKDAGFLQNCIIAGDFNTTMHINEKRGGSIVRDPFRERMEDMVSNLDLFDVYPSKGKYTWSNNRAGVGHIAARLDHFLIHSPLLSLPDNISSQIIPWDVLITTQFLLLFEKEENMGPIPFRFNPFGWKLLTFSL
jgi:hypothetical protein